jgi:formate/nitrite transporter FocA (FNT family)
MPSMKKGTVFSIAFLIVVIFGFEIISVNSIIQVFATVERSALESIDLHLEECIKQLQANYTKNALSHCEISEQELDALLENTTASK